MCGHGASVWPISTARRAQWPIRLASAWAMGGGSAIRYTHWLPWPFADSGEYRSGTSRRRVAMCGTRRIIDAIPLPKPRGPAGGKSQVPVPDSMSDDAAKVIAHLRTHGKNRPADRNALERHMGSMLGRKIAIEASRKIVSELEARKVVTFKGNKIEYKLPRKTHSPGGG